MSDRTQTKACATCGRVIVWRKKWERSWESVRFCSRACGSVGRGEQDAGAELDRRLEASILQVLSRRSRGSSICPSEAARTLAPTGWEGLMEATRRAAVRLAIRREVDITQRGIVVEGSRARGPIRIRKR